MSNEYKDWLHDEEHEVEEQEENLSFGESLEIILLEPFNGAKIGDVITVYRGIYNSLISLHKGLPVNCWENNVTNEQRLTINAKNLEEENAELYEANNELSDKVKKLEKELKNKQLKYDNKMLKTETYKTK